MNRPTITKEKITMSLDDIIAMEPLRYTAPPGTMPIRDRPIVTSKAYRPKVFGRLHHEPYKQGLMQRNGNHRPRPMPNPRPSPYDHNSFKFNGVHVTEGSALLNRRVGEVEIIPNQQLVDDYDIEEADDDSEEEVAKNEAAPTIGMPVCPSIETQRNSNGSEALRLYTDLNYIRLPVHQRLGWSSTNQFRKARVQNAAKFLRRRQTQKPQKKKFIKNWFPQSQTFLNKKDRKRALLNARLQVADNGMQVSFVNELARKQQPTPPYLGILKHHPQPLMDVVTMRPPGYRQPHQYQGRDKFVAPLSRQNVERLPGGRVLQSGASSFMSAFTNEEEILERICNVENLVSKLASSSSAMPMVDSGQLNQGAVLLPVAGGGLQAYVPLVANAGAAQQTCSAFQGHVVQAQEDGMLVVRPTSDARGAVENSRISRQLMAAAKRQPLTQEIQEKLWETRAAFRCNNHERASRESFTYRPTPHATVCSTNERIKQFLQHAKPKRNN